MKVPQLLAGLLQQKETGNDSALARASMLREATGLPYSLCPKDREVVDVENLALLYSLALVRKDPVLILNLKKKANKSGLFSLFKTM